MLGDRQRAKEQLALVTGSSGNRFEPAIRFVKSCKQTGLLAASGTAEEERDHLRKTGSNLLLLNRELVWEPRGAWQLVAESLADQACFAHNTTAAPDSGAAVVSGETSLYWFVPSSRGDRI
ncbi:MAG: hypothetical protein SGJ11_16530 [Phycisphaerae bacterium]|nr:hypothetical protein [Phycisphaerae bacterium]